MKRVIYRKLTKEEVMEIVKMYEDKIKGEVIAKHFGIPYKIMRKQLNCRGVIGKITWSEENLIWLNENYDKTYDEMSEYLGICNETIRLKINELGIKRTSVYRPFKIDTSDSSFWEAIDNPRLTAPDIVEMFKDKYGIGDSRIHQLRKQRGIKLQINHLEHMSTAEKAVKNILDKHGILFSHSKREGKFVLDFYLGFKTCIEVQGEYWHSKEERIERDARKKKYLEKSGYAILYVNENEISEKNILQFIKDLGFPILRSMENKPCERKLKRCIKKPKVS